MASLIDMTGRRCSRLLVLSRAANESTLAAWLCRCDCGTLTTVSGKSLRRHNTTSCGCAQREIARTANRTHGYARTKEYRAWTKLKHRCLSPEDRGYRNYGGRGISVAAEWAHDFGAFIAHIGPAPSARMSVERIDNERGYEPGNVKWATRHEQVRNTRRNIRTSAGVLKDACAKAHVKYQRAAWWIREKGMDPDLAIEHCRAMP
jgi:hypothetical protein